jgi:hypothetical protein
MYQSITTMDTKWHYKTKFYPAIKRFRIKINCLSVCKWLSAYCIWSSDCSDWLLWQFKVCKVYITSSINRYYWKNQNSNTLLKNPFPGKLKPPRKLLLVSKRVSGLVKRSQRYLVGFRDLGNLRVFGNIESDTRKVF